MEGDKNEEYMKKWEVQEAVRKGIEDHETRKEGKFVLKYELDLLQKDNDRRLGDLEGDNNDAKDRNKWLFRLVVASIIVSLIPIAIALLSQLQGNILK